MTLHTGRLLLCTHDPYLLPDRAALERTLAAEGFLGASLPGRAGGFLVGERFLQLVTFTGCSVQIELSPTDDGPFCHILVSGPFERPEFASGRNTRPPRCPSCRSPMQNWKNAISLWEEGGPSAVSCAACGRSNSLLTVDWKAKAGFGRLFVRVEEIFPGEAIPTPELMRLLACTSPGDWRHFYVQD